MPTAPPFLSRPPTPAALPVGDLAALARVMRKLPAAGPDPTARKRQLLAAFCRLLAAQFDEAPAVAPPVPPAPGGPAAAAGRGLPPRVAQTLERLLAGDSEKEAAARLGLSRNTLHVYVKALYRYFGVNSRGELFARFVRRDTLPCRTGDLITSPE